MHDLPRQLSVDELTALFEGRTRFVERPAECLNPLGLARAVVAALPEDEQRSPSTMDSSQASRR